MSHTPLKDLPGQESLIGRLYTNNDAPNSSFAIKDNLNSNSAPTINNDSSQNYGIGSIWMNLSENKAYLCFNASIGAAVWIELTAGAANGVPPGAVIAWSGQVAPAGWTLADGQDRDRVAFADLHALYQADGYIYGIGDGSTTFGIPDYRGRIPVGKDNMNGFNAGRMTAGTNRPDGDQLGAVGGLETNQLLIAHMPSHAHSGSTNSAGGHTHGGGTLAASSGGSHDHNIQTDTSGAGQVEILRGTSNDGANTDRSTTAGGTHSHTISGTTASGGSHTHTVSVGSTGGSDPHDNVQPSIIQNWIIKL